jgi:hypothetical protein
MDLMNFLELHTSLSPAKRYSLAVLMFLIAPALRLALFPVELGLAFITFFPAMVLTFAIFDIGLTLFNGLKVCQEVVLKQADDAMYQIKEAGRNQIRFYGEKG